MLENTRIQEGNNTTELKNDNRNLLDKTDNQKLSKDDIEKMKENEDLSGNQIIDRLIENSSSFNT